LKEVADNKQNKEKIEKYSSDREEIIVGKGKIAQYEQYEQFLLYPQ